MYSRRFKGQSKKKGEGCGFKLPPPSIHASIVERILHNGGSVYQVPSFSDHLTTYCVDMDIGICDCSVGQNGSVCKYQYFVWVYKHGRGSNFLPYLTPCESKEYSYIATGNHLPDEYYKGIHDQALSDFTNQCISRSTEDFPNREIPIEKGKRTMILIGG